MAFTHIHFDDQTQYGRQLRRMLNQSEEADDGMADLLSVMEQMRDGDGSQAAHYAEVTARFGFATDAKAKAAYDELSSAWSKISGNGQVTDSRAARDQLFAKLRG
jgi:hypothetical protein